MGEIRDPIYGFIITPTEGIELKIINTSIFQRLRRIKQLAMAYLVYPGANHTRFDHSLGVFYLASLMAEKLFDGRDNEEKRRTIRLAALLHDIGHGPFSHISEDLLEQYSDINTVSREKIHELITLDLINSNEELKKLLSPDEREKIIGILSGKRPGFSLMKNIISGPLDADKMDYLLRDSYFCGVKYGVFDYHRLFNTLTSYDDGGDRYIAVNFDGINSLEQFVLAKYYMTMQVYRHKIRSIIDSMIVRGVELGIEKDNLDFLKNIYTYENTDKYRENYLKYNDDNLLFEITSNKNASKGKEIFERLLSRQLFKQVFSEKLSSLEANEEVKNKLINIADKDSKDFRKKLENQIAEKMRIEADFVIANTVKVKSVKEMSRDSEGKIMIIGKDKKLKEFQEESTIFKSIDESMKDINFEVYAPVVYNTTIEKSKTLEPIKTKILELLKTKK